MTTSLRIVLAQVNVLVGDMAANATRLRGAIATARDRMQADMVVFPELALSGYPPEDLLLRPAFHRQVEAALQELAAAVHGITVLVGYPRALDGRLYNAVAVIEAGQVVAHYHKQLLPNYSVFDEKRYFAAGSAPCVVSLQGVAVGVVVCEDIWEDGQGQRPVQQSVAAGAQLVVVLNASPYHRGKFREREAVAARRARENHVPLLYLNLVGGQDELVFDGESFVVDAAGAVTQQAAAFAETLATVELEVGGDGSVTPRPQPLPPPLSDEASVYQALVLGVRDYIDKNGFRGVVIGLSGGIDSALTLALAVDAIGAARVEAVLMPSRYTAEISIEDAREESDQLGVDHHLIPIEPAFEAFLALLAGEFAGTAVDTTEENIQARCRGIILMAISNKKRRIVLTTGNKSEMSVGYATLYGDMAGGFAPIKDVPKLLVYRLARYRNALDAVQIRDAGLQGPAAAVIPERVLVRAPSAELAADQKDEDSLPPYEVLDPILEQYIELDRSSDDIIAQGFAAETVQRVVTLVNRNEYKRRQAPPGVRISRRAFGRDRRYPITSGFGDGTRITRQTQEITPTEKQ